MDATGEADGAEAVTRARLARMTPLSRQVARGKLDALSAGADIVRRELLGQ